MTALDRRVHRLKSWPAPFRAVLEGRKLFEFRFDDRGYDLGDLLVLEEWAPGQGEVGYTGASLACEITHVERGPDWGIPSGFVVMGIVVRRRQA